MLTAAFWVLCAASCLGAALAVRYASGPRGRPPSAVLLAMHAGFGAASLALLALALAGGLPPTGMGTSGFGPAAAILLALALIAGVAIARSGWRRLRPSELLIGTHATLAIAALTLLLALVALR